MATCTKCGNSGFGLLEIKSGKCPICRKQETSLSEEQKREVEAQNLLLRENAQTLLTTTETSIEGVEKRLGIVTGQCALGMNIFRDFTAEVRDVIGGRSGAYQKAIREAKDLCLEEMKIAASELGADAVVAVDLDFNEITGGGGLFGGKGMIMVVATGTAVKMLQKS